MKLASCIVDSRTELRGMMSRKYRDLSDSDRRVSWTVVPGGPASKQVSLDECTCVRAQHKRGQKRVPRINWPSSESGRPCTCRLSTYRSSSPTFIMRLDSAGPPFASPRTRIAPPCTHSKYAPFHKHKYHRRSDPAAQRPGNRANLFKDEAYHTDVIFAGR